MENAKAHSSSQTSNKYSLSLESQQIREENERLKNEIMKKKNLSSRQVHQENDKLKSHTQQSQVESQVTIDLCFLMDCTGSMGPWIQTTKDKIKSITFEVQTLFPGSLLRIAFVGYRDFDTNSFEILDFISAESYQIFDNFLSKTKEMGGGDLPEDVFGGYEKVLSINWKSQIRVLVHFADAPCHGKYYHDFQDDHKDFDSDGSKGKDFMGQFVGKRIDYYFCEIKKENTEKMTGIIQKFYDSHETKRQKFTILELNGSVENFFSKVVLAISTSGNYFLKNKI